MQRNCLPTIKGVHTKNAHIYFAKLLTICRNNDIILIVDKVFLRLTDVWVTTREQEFAGKPLCRPSGLTYEVG